MRILSADREMREGLEIDYAITPFPRVPSRWRSRITAYDPPDSFTDVQLRGPYARWEHHHTFRADGDGTIVEDDVTYEVPFGRLGDLVEPLLVRPRLRAIFDHRATAIARLLPATDGQGGCHDGRSRRGHRVRGGRDRRRARAPGRARGGAHAPADRGPGGPAGRRGGSRRRRERRPGPAGRRTRRRGRPGDRAGLPQRADGGSGQRAGPTSTSTGTGRRRSRDLPRARASGGSSTSRVPAPPSTRIATGSGPSGARSRRSGRAGSRTPSSGPPGSTVRATSRSTASWGSRAGCRSCR